MKIISIIGKADTRALAYPLLKALSLYGKTLVLSEDFAYCRLYEGSEDTGMCTGVDIKVCSADKFNDCISEAESEMYNHVVTISRRKAVEADKYIECISSDRTFKAAGGSEGEEKRQLLCEEADVVKVVYENDSAKGNVIELKDYVLRYIHYCEDTDSLPTIKDKYYMKAVCGLIARAIDQDEQLTQRMLTRNEFLYGDAK